MKQTKDYLKERFETGDIPTGNDFADLIDSTYNDREGADIDAALSKKVDKVIGKGLSSNDYTSGDKSTLLTLMSLFNVDTTTNSAPNMGVLTWNGSSNANAYTAKGTYRIKGERLSTEDNLPIQNAGGGPTIDGMLYVFDASLTNGTGETDDVTITQLLVLSNRVGGQQGGMWMRSAYGATKGTLTWKPWEKMQTNMEVGVVNDTMQLMDSAGNQTRNAALGMNNLVDNGIYSGVYIPNGGTTIDTEAETFVMVVLNNYATAAPKGWYYTIRQIKLSVNSTGEDTPLKMVARDGYSRKQTSDGEGYSYNEWRDVNHKLSAEVNALNTRVDNLDDGVEELYNRVGEGASIGANTTIPANTKIKDTSIDNFDDLWVAAGGVIDTTNEEAPYKIKALKNIEEANISLTYKEALATYQHRIMWPYMPSIDGTLNLKVTMVGTTGVFGCVDALPDMKKKVRSSYIEILYLGERNATYPIKPSNCNGFLGNCAKLRMVIGSIDLSESNNNSVNFFNHGAANLPSLTHIQLKHLKTDLLMPKIPNIDYASMEYLVNNATNTTNISIKVHADVYAKLTGDTTNAAAAALSTEELAKWTALFTTTTNKLISFGV